MEWILSMFRSPNEGNPTNAAPDNIDSARRPVAMGFKLLKLNPAEQEGTEYVNTWPNKLNEARYGR